MKKSKLILCITAAAVSLSLAISGTLMLFTTNTETATNVVTIGDLDIELWEKGKEIKKDSPDNEWKDAELDLIDKDPTVKHVGGLDAYLRVKAGFKISGLTDSSVAGIKSEIVQLARIGNPIASFNKTWEKQSSDAKVIATYLYALTDASVGSDWVFVYDLDGTSYVDGQGVINGYYYYVGGTSALAKFKDGDETGSIYVTDAKNGFVLPLIKDIAKATSLKFTGVTPIPVNPDKSIDSDDVVFAGTGVTITLQAQAVQITNETPVYNTPVLFSNAFDYESLNS